MLILQVILQRFLTGKHFLFGKKFKSKDNSLCLEVEKGVQQLNMLYCQCLLPAYIYTIWACCQGVGVRAKPLKFHVWKGPGWKQQPRVLLKSNHFKKWKPQQEATSVKQWQGLPLEGGIFPPALLGDCSRPARSHMPVTPHVGDWSKEMWIQGSSVYTSHFLLLKKKKKKRNLVCGWYMFECGHALLWVWVWVWASSPPSTVGGRHWTQAARLLWLVFLPAKLFHQVKTFFLDKTAYLESIQCCSCFLTNANHFIGPGATPMKTSRPAQRNVPSSPPLDPCFANISFWQTENLGKSQNSDISISELKLAQDSHQNLIKVL